jgi:hypothetical protein
MAKRRKSTSATQQIASLATLGMPAPVRYVATSRWGVKLLIVIVPTLLLTGVLTIQWKDGRPQFRFNRERAQDIRQVIEKKYGELSEKSATQLSQDETPNREEGSSSASIAVPPQLSDEDSSWSASSPEVPLVGRATDENQQSTPSRPFSRLRNAIDARR